MDTLQVSNSQQLETTEAKGRIPSEDEQCDKAKR